MSTRWRTLHSPKGECPVFYASAFTVLPSSGYAAVSVADGRLSTTVLTSSFNGAFEVFAILPEAIREGSFGHSNHMSKFVATLGGMSWDAFAPFAPMRVSECSS